MIRLSNFNVGRRKVFHYAYFHLSQPSKSELSLVTDFVVVLVRRSASHLDFFQHTPEYPPVNISSLTVGQHLSSSPRPYNPISDSPFHQQLLLFPLRLATRFSRLTLILTYIYGRPTRYPFQGSLNNSVTGLLFLVLQSHCKVSRCVTRSISSSFIFQWFFAYHFLFQNIQ